ncbi:hypothetical protein [Oscillibacter sp.]|uniref:hypothetical protein n=1 Tax=Oscillibacter sp. TaxID=1945593 RepID=UPI00289F5594|nr:hypothetical protein [Oscillibacter sp.]
MGLIKLLWDLYYFPRHQKFTLTPDDWPPDGSLHFVKCTDEAQKTVPNTHTRYQFSSNVGEDDRRIVTLSMVIMKRFCGSKQVLTNVHSTTKFSKKGKRPSERYPVQYRRFLEHMGSPASMYTKDEKTLMFLTKGFDAAVFWANKTISTVDDCFFDFYVLADDLTIANAEEAAETVAAGRYDVRFQVSECGPCALYVTLNPETVDAGKLQELIAAVCEENNILFQNPKGYEG